MKRNPGRWFIFVATLTIGLFLIHCFLEWSPVEAQTPTKDLNQLIQDLEDKDWTIRSQAAISLGTPLPLILVRHVLPNTVAPLIVQATFICASAVLVEALLSFLGIGIPPEIPTWGNVMAEGRALFRLYPHNILFPGIFLSLTVLAINIVGDGLRDTLDPRMSKRV